MDNGIGQLIAARREAMGMTQAALARATGNSPGGSYLSRIEAGENLPSSGGAVRLADALALPRDDMLNATGFATETQRRDAIQRLSDLVGQPAPVVVSVPVMDANRPSGPMGQRQVMLKKPERVAIVDLEGKDNEPYIGEVLYSTERKPREGQGVVALTEGRIGAYVWHTARTTGDWIENGRQERKAKFTLLGVIIRYVTAHELDEE